MDDAALVPDRLGRLVDHAVGTEHQISIEPAREPPVVRSSEYGALECRQALLQCLRRDQVEVVGRLI
jgi:hypothetical protein